MGESIRRETALTSPPADLCGAISGVQPLRALGTVAAEANGITANDASKNIAGA